MGNENKFLVLAKEYADQKLHERVSIWLAGTTSLFFLVGGSLAGFHLASSIVIGVLVPSTLYKPFKAGAFNEAVMLDLEMKYLEDIKQGFNADDEMLLQEALSYVRGQQQQHLQLTS